MLTQVFTDKYICTYYVSDKRKDDLVNNIRDSGKQGQRNKDISEVTKRRIKKMCATWFNLLRLYNAPRAKKEQLLPTFITLTYPINMQEDLSARRYELGKFITYMQRKNFLKRYLWKAEAQKNGSLHYHIITDNYIRKELVRDIWNTAIEKHVLQYGKEPFGTRIEAVKDHRKALSYVMKYMTKDDDRRQIGGNKWGSSDNLKLLQYFKEEDEFQIRVNQNNLDNAGLESINVNDFVSIYLLNDNVLKLTSIFDNGTKNAILEVTENNYRTLFNEQIML